MSTPAIPRQRALQLYRAILKELPPRHTPTSKRGLNRKSSQPMQAKEARLDPAPLHDMLRAMFASGSPSSVTDGNAAKLFESVGSLPSEHQASQLAEYLKAQRTYVHLLERYNPMLLLEDKERIRLTARRVGLDLPEEINKK